MCPPPRILPRIPTQPVIDQLVSIRFAPIDRLLLVHWCFMLSDKSPVWTHDETVGHIRNVNWNEPKQRLVWHCREVAANSNISVRLAVPQCLKLYLILRAVGCDACRVRCLRRAPSNRVPDGRAQLAPQAERSSKCETWRGALTESCASLLCSWARTKWSNGGVLRVAAGGSLKNRKPADCNSGATIFCQIFLCGYISTKNFYVIRVVCTSPTSTCDSIDVGYELCRVLDFARCSGD